MLCHLLGAIFCSFAGMGAENKGENNASDSKDYESNKPNGAKNDILCNGGGIVIIINCLGDCNYT